MIQDKELFWRLLEPEYVRAMMFCRKLAGGRDQGDDLFQDSLVAALSNLDSLREIDRFRPWLYRIIMNKYTSLTRQPWFRRGMALSGRIERSLANDDPTDRRNARRWLERAFQAVSAEQKILVTLHELQQWSVAELAELYRCSEGAIKARLFRARRRMKKALVMFLKESEASSCPQTEKRKESPCVVITSDVK